MIGPVQAPSNLMRPPSPESNSLSALLFSTPFPDKGEPNEDEARTFLDRLNPNSLETITGCLLEPSLATAKSGERFQFERLGYYCVDTVDSSEGKPVFNRAVSRRDTWAKIEKQRKA